MLLSNKDIVQGGRGAHHCRTISSLDGNKEALQEKLIY